MFFVLFGRLLGAGVAFGVWLPLIADFVVCAADCGLLFFFVLILYAALLLLSIFLCPGVSCVLPLVCWLPLIVDFVVCATDYGLLFSLYL